MNDTNVDIDIYNDNGEEIEDIQYDFENIKDDINEYDYSQDVVGVEEEQEVTSARKKKLIECSASIMLPFSEDVAQHRCILRPDKTTIMVQISSFSIIHRSC